MTSERVQRQVERLLDEAESAVVLRDWQKVHQAASDALTLDPQNADARALLVAAERGIGVSNAPGVPDPAAQSSQPDSFADGRYVVRRFLGEGGKKKVFLAHDARLDRDVAFALIKTEGLDEAARERITREAQAMGRLGTHTNIVTVYDIGEENGQPFLVLPVLEGGDVEGLIEKASEHKLAIDEVVRIGLDTCEGLEFLHSKGLVHRDVKPGNTWLTREGRAMIGDFGLAVAVDRSRLTQAGMMVGTVSYMAPEQAMGGEVTPRADLYALGAMLYEMVCGRPPFVGDESVAIIGQHLNTPPVAPTWHRPDCPPALETLILRLLEKNPEKRPASAAEVGEALKAAGQSGSRASTQTVSRAEPAAGADPLYRTVFVGREAELKQLQQAFDAAMSGQGGLVMVVGEPGIGKTAICQQLATYVSLRGGRTLVGHCYEEGSLSLPYLAFVEAMRTYVLARDPDGLKSDLGSGAADVARIVSEVRDRVSVELRDVGGPEDDRWRLLQSVTTFLRNAASVQPLVVVLEDLHWADRGTLDLLQHVARNLQGARLVVVGTYRDVEVDRSHPLSGAVAELRRSGTFLRVPLRGLTVDEVHRMYESLRGNEVPWAQAESVHRQTEGNPLFVQEVLRFLVEEGIVVRQGGRYVAQQPGEGVPEGLRDVIGRRLSHLDEKTSTVLTIASVIGRDFRLDVLQEVAGLAEDDLYAALEEASERAIVEQVQSPAGMAFRFTHAMFRTLLYEEIFAPRRIRLHQQIGRALEEIYARRLEEHAAELAEHFSQSTETADLEQAVRYGELAAGRAMAVYAFGEAVRHYEQALRAQEVLDPDDEAGRCDLLLPYAQATTHMGDPRATLDKIAPEVLRLAEVLGDAERASLACREGFGALSATGAVPIYGSPEAGAWIDAGERYARPDSAAMVHLHVAKAYRFAVTGKPEQSRDEIREARALSRKIGDPGLIWHADAAAATVLNRPTDAAEALELNLELLHRSPEGASLGVLGQVYVMAAGQLLVLGRTRESEVARERLAELAMRTRSPHLQLLSLFARVTLLISQGRFSEFTELDEQLRSLTTEGQTEFANMWRQGGLALARTYLGEYDDSPPPPGFLQGRPVNILEVFSSDRATASTRLDQLLSTMGAGRTEDLPPVAMSVLATGSVGIGHEAGCRLVEQYYTGYGLRTNGGIFGPQCIPRILGDCARILNKPQKAREEYAEAFTVCDEMGLRPEKALAALGLAEVLLDNYPDERDTAIEHLDFAIQELTEMKMQPALERALRHRGLLKA